MSASHIAKWQVVSGSVVVTSQKTYSAESNVTLEVAVPDSTTDKEVVVAIDVSQLVSIVMVSDQDLTIETNDGDTPDDTIALAANVPYVWNADQYGYADTKLTVDVTALYLTNASGAAATFRAEILQDPTP